MEALTFELITLLFLAALLAGFIDTLAGGGGLITLPALLAAGVPPLFALGTNKFQGTAGTATATLMMLRSRRITWADIKLLMLMSFIGATMGSLLVQLFDTRALAFVIPVVLLGIAAYFLFYPLILAKLAGVRIPAPVFKNTLVPGIGFYDGMFGPGTGSFFSLAAMQCRSLDLISGTALAKPLNFASNVASLLVFVVLGKVVWGVAVLMMTGQFIGAWLGSHCLIRINAQILRVVVVLVCVAGLVRHGMLYWG